jgi:DEAD/DEAH box helicase domain-containing protein
MAEVAAYARARDAAFSDESDEREREYYVTRRFYDAEPGLAKNAHVHREASFGFELQPALELREINFGRRPQANLVGTSRLGGEEVPEVEFIVCAECGQVHAPKEENRRGREAKHRPWCRARAKPEDKQPMEPIHLYREIQSEALRMLLPVAMLDPEVKLPNIEAAMALGLRRFFGGDPNHLELDLYSEPTVTVEEARRQYLLIYDTVPGGTGVLAELARDRGAKLRQAFELAAEALRGCECAGREGARACYRCLYGHRRQADLAVLDREEALALVDKILSSFEGLEPIAEHQRSARRSGPRQRARGALPSRARELGAHRGELGAAARASGADRFRIPRLARRAPGRSRRGPGRGGEVPAGLRPVARAGGR